MPDGAGSRLLIERELVEASPALAIIGPAETREVRHHLSVDDAEHDAPATLRSVACEGAVV
jgi:hypothetical protein